MVQKAVFMDGGEMLCSSIMECLKKSSTTQDKLVLQNTCRQRRRCIALPSTTLREFQSCRVFRMPVTGPKFFHSLV